MKNSSHYKDTMSSPEQALWRAMFEILLRDAINRARDKMGSLHKQQALNWLDINNKDFRICCDYAGYDPEYLHNKYLLLRRERELTPFVKTETKKEIEALQLRKKTIAIAIRVQHKAQKGKKK